MTGKIFREIDAAAALSRWYKKETTYVTSMRISQTDGKEFGEGYYVANPELHGAHREPSFKGIVEELDDRRITLTLTVTEDQLRGHEWALPGHKQIRVMVAAISANYQRVIKGDQQRNLILSGYDLASWKQQILPGDTIQIISTRKNVTALDNGLTLVRADAEILSNGQQASRIKGATLIATQEGKKMDELFPDQWVEGAAQSAGVFMLKDEDLNRVVPLFHKSNKARFDGIIRAGDRILYVITHTNRRDEFLRANVQTVRLQGGTNEDGENREEIGNVVDLSILLAPRDKFPSLQSA